MIAMLGDLKGVKNLISSNNIFELQHRITTINELFAKEFLRERNRSRTLSCLTFSDSILAIWDSDVEGKLYAPEFAKSVWSEIKKMKFPYRIFIDGGVKFLDNDNISNILSNEDERFKKIFPVAISIWSIFLAENSKFPEGVFIGEKIVDISKLTNNSIYEAGNFRYFQIE